MVELREFCSQGVGFEGVTEEIGHRVINNLGVHVEEVDVRNTLNIIFKLTRKTLYFNYLYFNQNKGSTINKTKLDHFARYSVQVGNVCFDVTA